MVVACERGFPISLEGPTSFRGRLEGSSHPLQKPRGIELCLPCVLGVEYEETSLYKELDYAVRKEVITSSPKEPAKHLTSYRCSVIRLSGW